MRWAAVYDYFSASSVDSTTCQTLRVADGVRLRWPARDTSHDPPTRPVDSRGALLCARFGDGQDTHTTP